jgi:hypothetical protein
MTTSPTLFSSAPSYIIGTLLFGIAASALFTPRAEYPRFGLPLEKLPTPLSASSSSITKPSHSSSIVNTISTTTEGAISPLIYLKSIREASYGLILVLLEAQGNAAGVTTFLIVFALVALGDGVLVWFYGGDELRYRVWGHWGAAVGLGAWAWWRIGMAIAIPGGFSLFK